MIEKMNITINLSFDGISILRTDCYHTYYSIILKDFQGEDNPSDEIILESFLIEDLRKIKSEIEKILKGDD